MRREQAEKKDAELRRVKEIRDTDKMLQSSPAAAAIPEKVAMRMGKRMLPFVGIPLFGSMGAFVAFWYFATYKNMEFQPGMVATTTIVILVSGLLVRTIRTVSLVTREESQLDIIDNIYVPSSIAHIF
jgi:Photosynthesis affected mutant 68